MLRVLCGAWLVIAASLIWSGLASLGLRSVDDHSLSLAIGRSQACALLLAIVTLLVGASVCARSATKLVDARPEAGPLVAGMGRRWFSPVSFVHLGALALAAATVFVGQIHDPAASVLLPVAAVSAFSGMLILPRWLLAWPYPWAAPSALLALAISSQLTVGWLHVLHPTSWASPVMLVEGLVMALAAASTARVGLFTPRAEAEVAVTSSPSVESTDEGLGDLAGVA